MKKWIKLLISYDGKPPVSSDKPGRFYKLICASSMITYRGIASLGMVGLYLSEHFLREAPYVRECQRTAAI